MFKWGAKTMAERAAQNVHSLLDKGMSITGDIRFEGGMETQGKVDGSIVGTGGESLLIVGVNATVNGGVAAEHVVVEGEVRGPVTGAKSVLVRSRGRIFGDVSYGRIQMEEGAVVQGKMTPIEGMDVDDGQPGGEPSVQPA